MEEKYDFIVLGTGLKECILSGLASIEGKKVLHMDRNSYYGGESASLNLELLYERYRPGTTVPTTLGRSRDYCIDLVPKFLMADGQLVKVLVHTNVTRYLDFKSVQGAYVYKDKKAHKVPASVTEAASSGLMGFIQKGRYKRFLTFVDQVKADDPSTHGKFDLNKNTAAEVFAHFALDANTQVFTGHCIAMYLDDSYLNEPALDLIERCQLYAWSVSRHGNSPYYYPIYGLGGLPEGFSRLCAVNGGVYMLNKPINKILYDENGRVTGVEDEEGKTAQCDQLIADPSYFLGTDKIKRSGQIARAICLLDHPINRTNEESCQFIVPAKHFKSRETDLYVSMVSYHHKVCPTGRYLAVVSGLVDGPDCKDEKEATLQLEPALKQLGKIDEMFVYLSDRYVPCNDPAVDGCFISSSYDATSHFESATKEVFSMYQAITGKNLADVMAAKPPAAEEE